MIVHCLFEQSGTFKNEFKKLGFDAYDYDILNEFNETDFIIDIFREITRAETNITSIFDLFSENDLILAFFPCTRFESQIHLAYQGNWKQFKNYSDLQKLEYDRKLYHELFYYLDMFTALYTLSIKRNLRVVIENPYHQPHFLTRYFPIKPTLIDYDRTKNGDYYEKPTQYFFINFEPYNNVIFEPIPIVSVSKIANIGSKVDRSLISPIYANRFIRQFLIEGGTK